MQLSCLINRRPLQKQDSVQKSYQVRKVIAETDLESHLEASVWAGLAPGCDQTAQGNAFAEPNAQVPMLCE